MVKILYRLAYPFYRIYAYLYNLRIKPEPLPPIPCQLCGKPGHVEWLCLNWRWFVGERVKSNDNVTEQGWFCQKIMLPKSPLLD